MCCEFIYLTYNSSDLWYRGPGFLAAVLFGSNCPTPNCLSFLAFLCVASRAYSEVVREEGKGVGEEPNHTTARKPGPLKIIQYSLVLPYWTKRIEEEQEGQVIFVLHIQRSD
jgi:hypothetical protein